MYKLLDFICQDCGNTFEKLINENKEQELECPKCSSVNVQRTWTKSNFKVHGQGAYNNKMVL